MLQEREIFGNLTIIPPIFVRVDGRTFHRLSASLALQKPFDEVFHSAMVAVCLRFLRDSGLSPVFAYTFSDEISLYFDEIPFSGRVEKIDSICASYAASALTIELSIPEPVSFDARIIAVSPDLAMEYLDDRQQEAWRNHMNAYCQHALMAEGMSSRKAADALHGLPSATLHEMMFQRGINLAKTPAWQRRGTIVCRKKEKKEGYNPVTGQRVEAERTKFVSCSNLPLFHTPEGGALLSSILAGP